MFDTTTTERPAAPPSPAARASLLDRLEVTAVDDDTLLDTAVQAWRHISWAHSVLFTALGELEQRFLAEDPDAAPHQRAIDVATEFSPAAAVDPETANHLVDLALQLCQRLPRTLLAMGRGEVDVAKAKVLLDVTRTLEPAAQLVVERVGLDHAPVKSARQLRRKLNDAAIRVDPEAAEKRRCAANRRRHVTLWTDPDGQATLQASGPAEKAAAIYAAIDRMANAPREGGDERSVHERRFDALYDLVVTEKTGLAGELHVVVSVNTLLGLDERPGLLEGYGAITADAVRAFAKDARWRRLLTDAFDGSLLDVGTTTYRPPEHLRRFIKIRDQGCIEPMCAVDARRTQLDHSVSYPDGPTAESNLACLCGRGHGPKTRKVVSIEQDEPGSFRYTTRLGRTYDVDRKPLLGFSGPDDGNVDPGGPREKPQWSRRDDGPPPF